MYASVQNTFGKGRINVEAWTSIMHYLDWYNRCRPHSSLGKRTRTPDEAYAVMLPTIKPAS